VNSDLMGTASYWVAFKQGTISLLIIPNLVKVCFTILNIAIYVLLFFILFHFCRLMLDAFIFYLLFLFLCIELLSLYLVDFNNLFLFLMMLLLRFLLHFYFLFKFLFDLTNHLVHSILV
jgi:hypothetical protein